MTLFSYNIEAQAAALWEEYDTLPAGRERDLVGKKAARASRLCAKARREEAEVSCDE